MACPVCSHPQREDIDHTIWLVRKSPRYVNECIPTLSRQQIRKHVKECPLHPKVRKKAFARLVANAKSRREA